MKEESLIAQRLVYDTVTNSGKYLWEYPIKAELRKSCKLSNQKWKQELEKREQEEKKNEKNLKRKMKREEMDEVKKQKLNVQEAIDSLRKGIVSETLASDENQYLRYLLHFAVICKQRRKHMRNYVNLKRN